VRVFLDTNVLVAAFATRGLCADVFRLTLAGHALVVSETVLSELDRSLEGKVGLPEPERRGILTLVREQATLAPEVAATIAVRDPTDGPILAAASAAADVVVTGDRDLLELEPKPLPIVTPREFWELARGAPRR
jgi:putative PIN family toxin of toxin-antitoxin system